MADNTKFIHLSTLNYQKIALNESQEKSTAGYGSTDTVTFTHNLGYIPSVRVWIKDPATGIWPSTITQFNVGNDVTNTFYVTSTSVVVRIINAGAGAKDFTVYCRVYYDE